MFTPCLAPLLPRRLAHPAGRGDGAAPLAHAAGADVAGGAPAVGTRHGSRLGLVAQPHPAISPRQCREARRLLAWTRLRLEAAAGVSERTIVRFEGGRGNPRPATLAGLRAALERAGVAFPPAGGVARRGACGVTARSPAWSRRRSGG